MNKIVLTADKVEFIDEFCRNLLFKLQTKMDTINDRTKAHTIDIRELKDKIRVLQNERKK